MPNVKNAKRLWYYERDNYKCYICGITVVIKDDNSPDMATLDHLMPQSKGGGSTEDNLRTCCFECNNRKCSLIFSNNLKKNMNGKFNVKINYRPLKPNPFEGLNAAN